MNKQAIRRLMAYNNQSREGLKLTDQATLDLLSALEEDVQPTQRGLARRIGVALGMTNSLLKRAISKGLVKVKSAPAKRYVYYVTPKGFSEKSRLVAEYLRVSLTFFRQAREEYADLFRLIAQRGHRRVALCGPGELAEIAILSALESNVALSGIVQIGANQAAFAGLRGYPNLRAALEDGVDAVVVTGTDRPQALYDELVGSLGAENVYAASLLHVRPAGEAETRS